MILLGILLLLMLHSWSNLAYSHSCINVSHNMFLVFCPLTGSTEISLLDFTATAKYSLNVS